MFFWDFLLLCQALHNVAIILSFCPLPIKISTPPGLLTNTLGLVSATQGKGLYSSKNNSFNAVWMDSFNKCSEQFRSTLRTAIETAQNIENHFANCMCL